MRTLIAIALVFTWACGAKPPPKTEQLKTDLAACTKNVDGIKTRIRQLMGEKIKVTTNRDELPADYDKTSIDRTLAQIESELMMRKDSANRMSGRCDTIADKLHAAEMAQPL